MDEKVFSPYEVKDTAIRLPGETHAEKLGWVGRLGETKNLRTITKKNEGVVVKQQTKGSGTADITITLHVRYNLLAALLGMDVEGLKKGMYAYGTKSIHKEVCMTNRVLNEDEKQLLKAYPRFVVTNAFTTEIDNGSDEVGEVTLAGTALPDKDGMPVYEALVSECEEGATDNWLTAFEPSMCWNEA